MNTPTLPLHAENDGLLIGLIAVQLRLLERADLIDGLRAWSRQRQRDLPDLLVERGLLSEPQRRGVEDILAQYNSRGPAALADWLSGESRVSGSGVDWPASSSDAASPSARYVVKKFHAQGGLGVVSVAEDSELQREVALKEMREPYVHDRASRSRFLREARLTGRLEHPGIVPVYGLGTHADGKPYYAMRFVHGQTMHDAIIAHHTRSELRADPSKRELSLRRLLSRFVAVCQTMAYAHRHGVIHRDLKPANVMLGEFGETLIVDWGLARVLHAEECRVSDEEATLPEILLLEQREMTRQGQVLGTPSFMSPEQAEGDLESVGPLSDVYALGATLYFLLTNDYPATCQTRATQPFAEMEVKLPPRIPGALGAICQKAMAIDPKQRYGSARELADDVERWFAGERVLAYREPITERLGRWHRRHRTLVSVLLTLLLASVVTLGIVLWVVHEEHRQTKQARDLAHANLLLAEENLELARKAVEECFLLARDHPRLQEPRMMPIKKLLLERALPFFDRFRSHKVDAPDVELEQARNQIRVAFITSEIGSELEAAKQYDQAIATLQRLVEAEPNRPELQVELAEARLSRSTLLRRAGRWSESHKLLSEIKPSVESLLATDPDNSNYQDLLLAVLGNESILLGQMGRHAESVKLLQRVNELRQSLLTREPDSEQHRRAHAASLHNLSNGLLLLNRPNEALSHVRQAIEIQQQLVAEKPNDPTALQKLGVMKLGEATLLHHLKQPSAAIARLDEAIQTLDRLVEEFPFLEHNQPLLGKALSDRGIYLLQTNTPKVALPYLQRGEQVLERVVKRFPDAKEHVQSLARNASNLGNALRGLGETEKAVTALGRSAELYEKLLTERPDQPGCAENLAQVSVNLGTLLFQKKRFGESLPHLERAVQLLDALTAREQNSAFYRGLQSDAHRVGGNVLLELGKHQEALNCLNKALRLADDSRRLLTECNLAAALSRGGNHAEAGQLVSRIAQSPNLPTNFLTGLAGILANCAVGLRADESRPLPVREKQARLFLDQAIALMYRAQASGLFDKPGWHDVLRTSPHLAPLRERHEFQQLLSSIQQSTPGK